MNKFIGIIGLALSLMASFPYGQVIAQEQIEEKEAISTMNLLDSTVTKISPEEIVVKKYDYSKYEDVETSFVIDSNVKVVNAESLEEIAVGSNVNVEYVVEGDKQIAKTLTLIEPAVKTTPVVNKTTKK